MASRRRISKSTDPDPLLPNRRDAFGPGLYRQTLKTPKGTKPGAKQLSWRGPLFLCLGAMFALSESTCFRKSEVALPNGEIFDDWRLRRASLMLETNGMLHADPPPELPRTVVAGRDKAVIKLLRSKLDQDGTIWDAHPIWLIFDPVEVASAIDRLQQIELQFPCRGPQRSQTPLSFSTANFAPMIHSTVGCYPELLLRVNEAPRGPPQGLQLSVLPDRLRLRPARSELPVRHGPGPDQVEE